MNAPLNSTSVASLRDKQATPRENTLPAVRAGFFDLQAFELIQRVSKAFSSSDLVPKQYQGNLANCMIAMDMAQRIGANPLMVMQNLYVVHGTPGWSSKFLIATINASGRYSSLRYEWKGTPGAKDYGCRAWAIERETGERLDGIWVTWEMVRSEGWDSKNGSKWKTMPDQMFVYRCAAFWQRAYAPELGMGLQTVEDIQDTFDAAPDGRGGFSVDLNALRDAAPPAPAAAEKAEDGEQLDRRQDEELRQLEQGQTNRVPPATIDQQTGEWTPSAEEAAAIREREMSEAAGDQQASAPRGRAQRSMNLE